MKKGLRHIFYYSIRSQRNKMLNQICSNSTVISESSKSVPNNYYVNTFKPRYESDPDLRKKVQEKALRYVDKVRDTEEYKERRKQISRECYERHKEEYRESRRRYAKEQKAKKALQAANALATTCVIQ